MADIELRSFQQILGRMISKVLAETDLTDVSPGSTIMTILEGAASLDHSQEAKLLQILNLRNLDKTKGVDLERLAIELGVTPGRIGAQGSSGKITISDSSFTKKSSIIYAGKNNPIKGDTVIRVVDASTWPVSGTVFIGRGSNASEQADYTAVTNYTDFFELTLLAPLQKDHLLNEEVVLSQGGNRTINDGTQINVPAANGSAQIDFKTIGSFTLLDGEDTITDIPITSISPGTDSNVGRNKITTFSSLPFSSAVVLNPDPTTGGIDSETDAEIRQRVKDNIHVLGKGTKRAIIRAAIGTSDTSENKRVVTAFFREPTSSQQIGVLFIDDGTGFQPSFTGIGQEQVVNNASGSEKFLQLQQWPIVKAQAASVSKEPFNLSGGESLLVEVDGTQEQKTIPASFIRTPTVALAQEIAEFINDQFTTVEARAKDGQLFITPVKDDPEYIRVGSASGTDANNFLRFSTRKQYTIRLYKNDKLINKNGQEAIIQSFFSSNWPVFGSSETLQLKIDGITGPLVTFTDAFFAANTTSATLAGASVADWVKAINLSIIGITARARDDGSLEIVSNQGASNTSSVAVIGGTLNGSLFPNNILSQGIGSEFTLNKYMGQIELASKLSAGDKLTAGTANTRAFITSYAQSSFNISTAPRIVFVVDGQVSIIPIVETGSLTFSIPSANVLRITGIAGQFSSALKGDYCFTYGMSRDALLKVIDVDGAGAYIDLDDPNPATGSDIADGVNKIIQVFRTDYIPQVVEFPTGTSVANTLIASTFNSAILGATATVKDDDSVEFRTDRFIADGAICVAACGGSFGSLGLSRTVKISSDSHIAAVESGDLVGIPSGKIDLTTADLVAPYTNLVDSANPFASNSDHNKPLINYLGSNSGEIRQPRQKLSTSNLELRDEAPFPSAEMGLDQSLASGDGIELAESDNMVFILDNDATKKTFDVPMYLEATINAASVPTSLQFDAIDDESKLLGSDPKWSDHKFEDYKLWIKSRKILPNSVANANIKLTSKYFGPNGDKIWAGIFYPIAANSPITSGITLDTSSDKIIVKTTLGSGPAKAITLGIGEPMYLDVSGTGPYTYKLRFISPVNLATIVAGDLANLDSSFNSANRQTFKVTSVDNLSDSSRVYEHKVETNQKASVSGTTVNLAVAPTYSPRIGDKVKITSFYRLASASGPNTITTAPGDPYQASAGILTINSFTYTYASYNSLTGVFTGVAPDPNGVVLVGDEVYQTTTSVLATVTNVPVFPTQLTITPSLGTDPQVLVELQHSAITLDAAPTFSPQIGDRIQSTSQNVGITAVYSSTEFGIDQPFVIPFGPQTGTVSRIMLTMTSSINGVSETTAALSASSVSIFGLLGTNDATSIIDSINGTVGVNSVVLAENATGSSGSGVIFDTTAIELGNGNDTVQLLGGESYVKTTYASNPALELKLPLEVTPEVGDKIRLIPANPKSIYRHLIKKHITGLTIASDVALVDAGKKIQVSSKIVGGTGQVYAIGGKASGLNVLPVRNSSQSLSSSRGLLEFDRSAIEQTAPGQRVFLYQTGRAKKNIVGGSFIGTDTVQVQLYSPGVIELTTTKALAQIYSWTHTGTVKWAIRKLSKNRVRYQAISGTCTLPALLKQDDWVLVGNGENYAGTTIPAMFNGANRGWFQVRETDNLTYFDVDNSLGQNQTLDVSTAPFLFTPYHSARIGDQISVTAESPLSSNHKGTFTIIAVPSLYSVRYKNTATTNEGPLLLGSGVDSIKLSDQGYSTYRKVEYLSPKPSDPANKTIIVVSPGHDINLFSESLGAKASFPNKLGFSSDPVSGINGYQYWVGLKQKVQKIIDGFEPDMSNFPGVKAGGSFIEVREPQIQRVTMNFKVKTKEGVALSSIADDIKNSVVGYINSLGLGNDVVLSEIVSLIQSNAGVEAVVIVSPDPSLERITINDNAVARTSSDKISLS